MLTHVGKRLESLCQPWMLPRGVAPRTNSSAHALLSRYIAHPEDFWVGPGYRQIQHVRSAINRVSRVNGDDSSWFDQLLGKKPEAFWLGLGLRQAKKVSAATDTFRQAGIDTAESLSSLLLDGVEQMRSTHNRPFFVMSAAGSGSTWLGTMLGDLPHCCYAREVYLPRAFSYLCRRHHENPPTDAIWATMLLHSWSLNCPEERLAHNFVNSGRSIFHYHLYRSIWPGARFVFLVRDPRDQLLSTTYRKRSYRSLEAPHVSNARYLRHNARKYMEIYRLYKQISPQELHVVKYETLKQEPTETLRRLLEWAEFDVSEEALRGAIFRNDAQNMRTGVVPPRGNLDQGGKARSWREVMGAREMRIVMPIIGEALETFEYV
jgi:hypothetical protein